MHDRDIWEYERLLQYPKANRPFPYDGIDLGGYGWHLLCWSWRCPLLSMPVWITQGAFLGGIIATSTTATTLRVVAVAGLACLGALRYVVDVRRVERIAVNLGLDPSRGALFGLHRTGNSIR